MANDIVPDAKKLHNRHLFWLGVIILIGFLLPVVDHKSGNIEWAVFSEISGRDFTDSVTIFLLYPAVAGVCTIIASLLSRGIARSIAIIFIGVFFLVALDATNVINDDDANFRIYDAIESIGFCYGSIYWFSIF